MDAEQLIALLQLQPHPLEGGFFRETYKCPDVMPKASLPDRYPGDRLASTAIYYLLTPDTCSHLHRLRSDEVFHFYLGSPVTMLQLGPEGGRTLTLGPDIQAGQLPQVAVPRDIWQGTFLPAGNFALLGCTVAPGFDYADYEHGNRTSLIAQYPAFSDLIRRLTRTT